MTLTQDKLKSIAREAFESALMDMTDAVEHFHAGEQLKAAQVVADSLRDAMYKSLRLCQSCQGLVIDCINRCPACRALLKVL